MPTLIVTSSIVLAMASIGVDTTGNGQWQTNWPRLFGANAAGARGMLSTIAGSMMTVVGVTFSMVLVTLALASSQYTSRILRNFMRDRITQVVLGIFTGIFTYCLIVLRTIRDGDADRFVPSLAVAFGVVLAIGGIGVLIFFIHHIASSIQASSIIASVAEETMQANDWLFPGKLGHGPPENDEDQPPTTCPEQNWQAVPARRNGYIQSYLAAILSQLAARNIPSSHRYEKGELRVIAVGPTFERLVAQSFDQIRGSAGGNVGIMLRMLGALQTIGSLTADPLRRRALREQVEWIAELAERTIAPPHDRAQVESRLARVRDALETKPILSKLETPGKM